MIVYPVEPIAIREHFDAAVSDITNVVNFFGKYPEERAHLNHIMPQSDSARWENPLAPDFNANCYGFACNIGLDIQPGVRGIVYNTGHAPKWREIYQNALDYRTKMRPDPESFGAYCNSVIAGLLCDEAAFGLAHFDAGCSAALLFFRKAGNDDERDSDMARKHYFLYSDYHLVDIRVYPKSGELLFIDKARPLASTSSGCLTLHEPSMGEETRPHYLAQEMARLGYSRYAGVVTLPHPHPEERELIIQRLALDTPNIA